jgi:formate hydrogenlyase subunit 6/NADH:ubiquinone oxidoreductase subunit I
MTDVFEYSEFKRENLVYRFSDLTTERVEEKRRKAEEFAAEQEKKKAEAAKAAAAKKAEPAVKPDDKAENK